MMFADSVKLKGFSCFKEGWAGFDEFKPITVIIGRNNTGKSHLLDMVELVTNKKLNDCGYEVSCSGCFDEEFLDGPFKKDAYGGKLGPRQQGEHFTHWGFTGRHFDGCSTDWTLDASGNLRESVIPTPKIGHEQFREAANHEIKKHLLSVVSPLYEKRFRRILADRDINPESASKVATLDANGTGATNIIQNLINGAHLPEELIQQELLALLKRVFRADAKFEAITVNRHDETEEAHLKDKWEINLYETHKGRIPLSSSGSGLNTVILVLLNLLVIPKIDEKSVSSYVFAFEELENNLHPALLRRLLKVITEFVEREKCYVFLTTHSNVALDFFSTREDSQVIHVTHDGKSAFTKTISTHFDHVGLLTELGSRPSDLLQANGVIWLEGPSDRIYFNRFIQLYSDGELREGRDYQCAFYGGSNLANTTFDSPDDGDETFTNLLRLNNNIAVVCDGDRTAKSGPGSRIKGRVQRIKQEVEKITSAFLWITEAKEIENYIPGEVWAERFSLQKAPDPDLYDRFPSTKIDKNDFVQKHLNRKSFDKVKFAMDAVPFLTQEMLHDRFDFGPKMNELVTQIKEWNK